MSGCCIRCGGEKSKGRGAQLCLACRDARCSVDGCDLKTRGASDLCWNHVRKARRHGDGNTLPTCSLDGCDAVPWQESGECRDHFVPTYRTIHSRLTAQRGKASDQLCIACGAGASGWALSNRRSGARHKDERINCEYSLSLDDYDPMCHRCHMHQDHMISTCLRGHALTDDNRGWDGRCLACHRLRERARVSGSQQGVSINAQA